MRPRRLDHFDDIGDEAAGLAVEEFLRSASQSGFAVIAYCFMPDHIHALVAGTRDDSNLRRFAKLARQRLTIAMTPLVGGPVWQDGFYERTLRDEEDTRDVVAYILQNPIRRGLAASAFDYRWSGSSIVDLHDLLDAVAWQPGGACRN